MADTITSFDLLRSRTKEIVAAKDKPRALLIGADEPTHIKSMVRARREGLIEPVFIGPKDKIIEFADLNKTHLGDIEIIDSDSLAHSVARAAEMAVGGEVDFLIKGNITTGYLLSRLFERPTGMRQPKKHVSHIAVFEHEKYPRLLFMSDGAVTIAPDINRKLSIIRNAVGVVKLFGIDKPRVGILAAVEVIYTAMPVTMDGAVISKMVDKGQIKDCYIDGPVSMDVALVPEVAAQKGAVSEVAGRSDIIIAPNIETGNGIYKAMSMFCKARTAGVVVGAKAPIALSSRCDNAENIYSSLLLSTFLVLQA